MNIYINDPINLSINILIYDSEVLKKYLNEYQNLLIPFMNLYYDCKTKIIIYRDLILSTNNTNYSNLINANSDIKQSVYNVFDKYSEINNVYTKIINYFNINDSFTNIDQIQDRLRYIHLKILMFKNIITRIITSTIAYGGQNAISPSSSQSGGSYNYDKFSSNLLFANNGTTCNVPSDNWLFYNNNGFDANLANNNDAYRSTGSTPGQSGYRTNTFSGIVNYISTNYSDQIPILPSYDISFNIFDYTFNYKKSSNIFPSYGQGGQGGIRVGSSSWNTTTPGCNGYARIYFLY
jgi:hypothetical protein